MLFRSAIILPFTPSNCQCAVSSTRNPGPAWGPNLVTQPNPTRFLGWVGLRLKKCWVGLGSAKRPKKTQVLGSSASERCMKSRCAFSYFALPRGVRLLIANRMCAAYWRLFANERSSPTVVIGWPDLALEIIGLCRRFKSEFETRNSP